MKKKSLFYIIALTLPIFGLIFLEFVLRILNYGDDYPLFVEDKFNSQYLTINENVALRYFNDNELKTTPQYDVFLKEKSPLTFRIVVQGESTSLGFPYLHGASFPRIIEHMLQMKFPEKHIEVINTSLAATNSYTLFDLGEEIVKIDPDLIIISSGHNEFYGALGVASTQSLSTSPSVIRLYMKLRKIRIVQLIRKVILALKNHNKHIERPVTTMERMVKHKTIKKNTSLYKAGVSQFENNLNRLLKKYHKAKIPVILLTQVSNHKDQRPLSTQGEPPAFSHSKKMASHVNLDSISNMALKSIDSANAAYHFTLANFFLQQNKYELAKKHFIQAKDFDLLRFRAPDEINKIIKSKANEGVSVIDIVNIFEVRSPENIIGKELITEHLHPNIEGQVIIAQAIVDYLSANKYIKDWQHDEVFEQSYQAPLITRVDSIFGDLLVTRLKTQWPLRSPAYEGDSLQKHFKPNSIIDSLAFELYQQKINWLTAMITLQKYYSTIGKSHESLLVAQAIAQEFEHFPDANKMAGDAALLSNKKRLALFYYKKAFNLSKDIKSGFRIAELLVELGLLNEAKKYLIECDQIDQSTQTRSLIKAIDAVVKLESAIKTDSTNLTYLIGLSAAYRILGVQQKSEYYENIIQSLNNH